MSNLPDIELLESTHTFPGPYTFKVIGANDASFQGRVVAAVRGELPGDREPAISVRKTASGRHVSVTIEPLVDDAEQVLAIYRQLYHLDGLVMVW